MKPRKLRRRAALASSLGGGAFSVALALSAITAGTASAATIPQYPGTPSNPNPAAPVPSFGTYPNWLPYNATTGAEPISNVDHSEGSDTTLFVMQSISSLYSHGGILPFTCGISGPTNGNCLEPNTSGYGGTSPTFNAGSSANPNNTQSDETDNFSGTEELQGQNDVGSGAGQTLLCGGTNPVLPSGTTINYARSSKPFSASSGSGGYSNCKGQAVGFAKDAVLSLDFTTINPGAYGSATGYVNNTTDTLCPSSGGAGRYPSYSAANGTLVCTAFPTTSAGGNVTPGLIGPVADGWLPNDPTNCGTGGGPACSGTPFQNIDNTSGLTGVPYRLFCQHGAAGTPGSATPNESQITDWGQLTNLSAAANGGTAQTVGNGAPIGVPIRVIGINSGSGTVATMYAFDQSGVSQSTDANGEHCSGSAGAPSSSDVNVNAASGADPENAQGPAGSNFVQNPEISVENSTSQIGDFAFANWATPGSNTDAPDQAVDIATSLYSESRGAFLSQTNDETTSIESAGAGATNGVGTNPSTFTANVMNLNGVTLHNTLPITNGTYATARTLFNIFRTDSVNASTGGFLNWMCDSNSAIQKGTDHIIGGNFDADLTNIINNQYKFVRLTDLSPEIDTGAQTPNDHVSGGDPNGTCQANLGIASVSSDGLTITLTGNVPSTVQSGWTVSLPTGSTWGTDNQGPTSTYTVQTVGTGTGTGGNGIPTNAFTLNKALLTGTGSSSPPIVDFPGHPPVLSVTDPAT